MVDSMKSWFKENSTLVLFLLAQAATLFAGAAYGLAYTVRLEGRVDTLETRGSSHLAGINNRLTVTEKETEANKARIDRIVEIMLRELPVKREQLRP
jgi:Tfp pilus assembly protein PilO